MPTRPIPQPNIASANGQDLSVHPRPESVGLLTCCVFWCLSLDPPRQPRFPTVSLLTPQPSTPFSHQRFREYKAFPPLCWVFGLEPSRSPNRGGDLPDFSPTAGMSRPIAPSTRGAVGRGECAKRRHQAFPFILYTLPRIRGQEGPQALAVPGDLPGAVLVLEGRTLTTEAFSLARGAREPAGHLSARTSPPTRPSPTTGGHQ